MQWNTNMYNNKEQAPDIPNNMDESQNKSYVK